MMAFASQQIKFNSTIRLESLSTDLCLEEADPKIRHASTTTEPDLPALNSSRLIPNNNTYQEQVIKALLIELETKQIFK